jgi:hypothetical protein
VGAEGLGRVGRRREGFIVVNSGSSNVSLKCRLLQSASYSISDELKPPAGRTYHRTAVQRARGFTVFPADKLTTSENSGHDTLPFEYVAIGAVNEDVALGPGNAPKASRSSRR